MNRTFAWLVWFSSVVMLSSIASADPMSDAAKSAAADIDSRADELKAVNQSIWKFAEVGLKETKSSNLLLEKLKFAGFEAKSGISGMPTAYVASDGSGKPIQRATAQFFGGSTKVARQVQDLPLMFLDSPIMVRLSVRRPS